MEESLVRALAKAILSNDGFAISMCYNRMLNLGFKDHDIIKALASRGYISENVS